MTLRGWHHVTAITGDAPGNLRFYRDVLGLRLVKRTVNQDDVSAYHLFFADAAGTPGTDVTFFDWPATPQHRAGVSDVSRIGLRVPPGSIDWWLTHFRNRGVEGTPTAGANDRRTLPFTDPEGQRLALIESGDMPLPPLPVPWDGGGVPAEAAIRGLGPLTLTVRRAAPTIALLTEVLGFQVVADSAAGGQRLVVLRVGADGAPGEVHLEERPDLPFMRQGRGGVHHVALRTADDAAQQAWLDRLRDAGVANSGIVDRFYFRSLYFREPNGILFELATDGPGFATDEAAEVLGDRLALPPFLEPRRQEIEAGLAPLG